MDDDGKSNGLLEAARGLANAFSDLLNSLKPGEGKVGTSYQRVFKAYFSTAKLQETQNYIDLKKQMGCFNILPLNILRIIAPLLYNIPKNNYFLGFSIHSKSSNNIWIVVLMCFIGLYIFLVLFPQFWSLYLFMHIFFLLCLLASSRSSKCCRKYRRFKCWYYSSPRRPRCWCRTARVASSVSKSSCQCYRCFGPQCEKYSQRDGRYSSARQNYWGSKRYRNDNLAAGGMHKGVGATHQQPSVSGADDRSSQIGSKQCGCSFWFMYCKAIQFLLFLLSIVG